MKRFTFLILLSIIVTISACNFAYAQRTSRIYRPCPGSTTPAAVTISVLGAISISPCSGQTVTLPAGTVYGSSFTQGSIVFAGPSGTFAEDVGNLLWDDTNNRLIVGAFQTAVASSIPALVAQFSAESTSGTRFNIVNFANGAGGPDIRGWKARGTAASPSAVLTGDSLIGVSGGGWSSASTPTVTRGFFNIAAAEDWSAGAQGTYVAFWNTSLGTTTIANQLRIYPTSINVGSGLQYGWASSAGNPATLDTGFARQSAGVIRATDGANAIRALIGGGAAVASANPLPTPTGRVFHVTGTTGFNAIQSGNFAAGVCITMIFDDALTVTDNAIALDLAGNFVTTANDTLSVCYDGNLWYETGRSVN